MINVTNKLMKNGNGENQSLIFGLEEINLRKISNVGWCFLDVFLKIRPP